MRLVFLVPNQAWVFVYGGDLIRMGDFPMFFEQREAAVEAARTMTLDVDKRGVVSAITEVST